MTLYLDVIWLLNWLFDCLLLYWTAIILKRRVALWRVCIGGLIGSFIIVVGIHSFLCNCRPSVHEDFSIPGHGAGNLWV
ncbi:sigma-E processing peptidase SpoIIGA [Peribacillus sp. V2I11]|uniref:sigma-E processing peptidase SpoIIGA n=1 Tax=Peribacillus sp. V2I11 TaxID=3042277 RepID=UPI002784E81E|nr:sigma-E processing peptidase SpoIIGA [Peribacillus sp. V2I11]MDQ0879669.1 hypothetical protein [Peribacillus sp. V2I11]